MTTQMKRRCCAAALMMTMIGGGAVSADAQSPVSGNGDALRADGTVLRNRSYEPCGTSNQSAPLFSATLHDIARRPSRESLEIMAVGAAAALGTRAADAHVSDAFSRNKALRDIFRPGAAIGSMPLEVSAAVATMALGRAIHKPCAVQIGSELLQAQLAGAAWSIAIKQVTRRERPSGGGFSFPSGTRRRRLRRRRCCSVTSDGKSASPPTRWRRTWARRGCRWSGII